MGRVKDYRDGFKEWFNRPRPAPIRYYCQTCCGEGSVNENLMPCEEPCPDCKGIGLEPLRPQFP